MIELDGSHGEGGGQIIRTALAYATLTQQAFTIRNIRRNRPQAGLKNQHLHCITALNQLCKAQAEGAELGSETLTFYPAPVRARKLELDIGTAGSITLLLQSILPAALFAPKPVKLSITGGTDTKWSPPADYFMQVLLPQLRRFADIECAVEKRGYYPRGGGKISLRLTPHLSREEFPTMEKFLQALRAVVPPYDLRQQHHLIHIKGLAHAAVQLQGKQVAERMAHASQSSLRQRHDCPVTVATEYQDTLSPGCGLTLWAIFSRRQDDIDPLNPIRLGADALGEKIRSAEQVAGQAVALLEEEIASGAPVDARLADHLIPYLSLSGGVIHSSALTSHALTNIATVEKFLGKTFLVDEENHTLSCPRV